MDIRGYFVSDIPRRTFLERAINFEVERQIDVLEEGGAVVQETRLYDAERDETRPMRTKEEANDYRYFPDPDLLPVEIEVALIEQVRGSLPELPDAKRRRRIRTPHDPRYRVGRGAPIVTRNPHAAGL